MNNKWYVLSDQLTPVGKDRKFMRFVEDIKSNMQEASDPAIRSLCFQCIYIRTLVLLRPRRQNSVMSLVCNDNVSRSVSTVSLRRQISSQTSNSFFWKDRSLLHSRFVQSIKVKMPSQILLWIQGFQEKFTNNWYGTIRRFHRKEVAKHRKKTQFCPDKNYWSRSRILLYRTWIPLNRAAFETLAKACCNPLSYWLNGHDPAISFYW